MNATVNEGLTFLDKALWVVDHATITDLPLIDEAGAITPGSSQEVPGAGRLAHEVLTEVIRRSPRGVSRQGLTTRLWLVLQTVVAFEGTASIKGMHSFATGRIPRDLQWELGIPGSAVHLHSDLAEVESPGALFPVAAFTEAILD